MSTWVATGTSKSRSGDTRASSGASSPAGQWKSHSGPSTCWATGPIWPPVICNGGFHQGISPWKHGHFFQLQVTGRHLPTLLAADFPAESQRIRYVKIDTEGFDRAVAGSLRDWLVGQRPYLKTEMYKHTPREEREGYYRDLRDLGYTLYRIADDDQDYRTHALDERDLMKWSHFDVFAEPQV